MDRDPERVALQQPELRPILTSPAFYLLALGSMCSIAAVGGTNQHLKLFLSLDRGYSQADAAGVISLVLAVSIAGRLLMGWLSDRMARKHVMLLIYLLVASAIPLLLVPSSGMTMYVFAAIFGLGLGGEYLIIPLMAGELFGVRVLGRVMGIVLTADGVAEATAPMLVGYLRDRTGSYDAGFITLVCAALLGTVAIWLLPTTSPKPVSASVLMRIVDGKVIVCSPGRNFVTLKLITEDGVYGLGDATLNGRELAVASYLSDHVLPLLIGRDARRIEDIWQYLYKGAYWRRGPVTMTAISAVDTALWDILGKTLNAPVYQLLGGASRESVMVYGHANGATEDDTVKAVQHYIELGYKAVRAQCAIPGVLHAYGVGRGTLHYEPAEKGKPLESVWSTEQYLDFVPPLFDRLRREVGYEVHLLHDVHHRLTPIEAARLGKSLEPSRLFWLEDPVPAENQASFRTIREHTTTPIAVGEVFNVIHDCTQLIEEELIDYIRMTVVHGGGISHLRKVAALAELHHVRTGSHGATDLSPVAMAAALHFDLSVHNFGIQEYMRHTDETDAVFPHKYAFERGAMHPGDAPGLGVDIDEALAATHPYDPAYLPVNRKLDGTVHSW